jgi:zinc protease
MNLRFLPLALAGLALAGTAASGQERPPVSPPATAPSAAAPSPVAMPWPQQTGDLPADPDVRFGTLPNGMRYAIRRNATPPGNASIRLRIHAGSMNESEAQRGLAHFLEHMVLNRTTHVPEGEFARRLERHGLRMGADTNAMTDWTQTVFKLDLPQTDAESVETALFLLREIADEASLAQPAIDSERGIVQAENRTRAGAQLNIIADELSYMMPGQLMPQRIPNGLEAVIANASRERLVAFYNAWYRPERATLIAVGDFSVDEMERRIRAGFGSWRGQGPAGTDPDPGTPARRQTEARIRVEAGAPARVSLAWVRPPDRRPDSVETRAARTIDELVLQILNRRLERIAATRSPAPFVVGMGVRTTMTDSADVTILLGIVQPGEWRRALNAIDTERRRIAADGVTREELAREMEMMGNSLAGLVTGAPTRPSAEYADAMATAVDLDQVFTSARQDLALFDVAAERLNVRRINRAARAMFSGDPLLYMTSPTPVEGGEAALLAAYREAEGVRVAAAAAPRAPQAWPYTSFGTPGTVAEQRVLAPEIGATIVRFANGVRLTVKHTEFADDHILISVRAGNGRLDLPADRATAAWALPGAFPGGGLGRISADDMQDALSGRGYSNGFAVEDDAFVMSGSTRSGDLALQMQILAAQVSDPGWRPGTWDRIRGLSGTLHDTFETTPGGVFGRDSGALLHGGDLRWAIPSRAEMAASTMADVRAALQRPLAEGPIEVIMVGDVSIDAAIRETAATFGALPARPATPAPGAQVHFPAPTAAPIRLTHTGRSDQALAMIAWPAADYFADPRQARALDLLADVFMLRLTQEVRERQATGYAPQAGHEASRTFAGYGIIMGAIEARPEALPGFMRDSERIAADLRDRPIEADELQRAMLPRVETLQRERAGNGWWLASLAHIQTDPRVAAAIASEVADYRAITPGELQRVARAFLQPDRAYKLIVVPREGAPAS